MKLLSRWTSCALLSIIFGLSTLANSAIVVGDFNLGDWTSEISFASDSASFSTSVPTNGSVFNFSHTYNQDIVVAHLINGFQLDPNIHAEASVLNFSIDTFVNPVPPTTFPDARICFGVIAKQDNNYFRQTVVDQNGKCTLNGASHSYSITSTLGNLVFEPLENLPGISLDFSGAANPIQLGVFTANFGASITQNRGGYFDNVAISVSAVPVPGAAWLFGSGLIGLIGIAKRKKKT